jgi:fatty-acyl-CoA synthase
VCVRQVDPGLVWRLFHEEGVIHYNGSPTVQLALVDHADAAPLQRPLTAMVAAAPPSPTLLARIEQLNTHVVHVWATCRSPGLFAAGASACAPAEGE